MVGQPPINLLDAALEVNGGEACLRIPKGDFSIPISANLLRSLQQRDVPREFTVGIRPMDISINSQVDKAAAQVRSDVFEPFGSLGLLSVKTQDMFLELLLSPELTVEPDYPLGIDFREDRLIFFDPVSENNLLSNED